MLAADSNADVTSVNATLSSETGSSWKSIIDPVEPFLDAVSRRLAGQVHAFDPDLAPYADYALNGQGKHLRPALVALTANSLGKPSDAHITVAVVIEMVHLATLVHDDIMDGAEIRRGKLSLAANWGNDIAVLFGDCLFAQALTLAASFPTPEVCRAIASATNTVCSGEILQTNQNQDFNFTREKYFRILEMKTAELFAVACELSAYLSNATPEQRSGLRQFGLSFGTAYQIYDDCLDLFGTEAAAGKSLGTDLQKGKLTLPVLLAWERAASEDRAALQEMVSGWQPALMMRLMSLLRKYDTLAGSLSTMNFYLETARQSLLVLPNCPGRSSLFALTQFLASQTDSLSARS